MKRDDLALDLVPDGRSGPAHPPLVTSPVVEAVRRVYEEEIHHKNTTWVSERLRHIARDEPGLGVAVLVAWQHGIESGHIRRSMSAGNTVAEAEQVRVLASSDACPYTFVHVPVREIRRKQDLLMEWNIMNRDADPAGFVYHEDGLVGTFSFTDPESRGLNKAALETILRELQESGFLVEANVNNRQIQFKDLAAKERIEKAGEKIYVRVHIDKPTRENLRLPKIFDDDAKIWTYVKDSLQFRSPCNYCSVQTLNPLEATVHSAHPDAGSPLDRRRRDTVRNYQLGFTFAPVGDPEKVCHFVAWDFPHINDLVINMEPQAYSISDLVRLVRNITDDVDRFCRQQRIAPPAPRERISGGCNHWAGNSIYHQHYQFMALDCLPLFDGEPALRHVVTYNQVRVSKACWPAPAFFIESLSADSSNDADVMKVADRIARQWLMLNDGNDWTFGNKVAIKHHTENIFVSTRNGHMTAVFIPRHRARLDTHDSRFGVVKKSAGMLEMMGYFVIDNRQDFDAIERLSPEQRTELGDLWLTELSPADNRVAEFEENIRTCLDVPARTHEDRIENLLKPSTSNLRQEAVQFLRNMQHDGQLRDNHRALLFRELLWAVLESDVERLRPPIEPERVGPGVPPPR